MIAPFDQMSSPFQAILWGRVLPLETFDEARVTAFWEQWGGRTNLEKLCPTPNQSTAPTVSDGAGDASRADLGHADPRHRAATDRRAERRRALPELTEATAVRLVSYFGPDDAGSGIVVGDRVIPLVDYAGLRRRPGRARRPAPPGGRTDRRRRARRSTTLELLTPVIAPGKIVCVGLNYREHASEGGRPAPTRPLLFSKFANALVADGQPIVRPEGTHALDLEVELGVVIGTTARRVSRAEALDHVAGYVVVNDVSARDWQGIPAALAEGEVGDGQWLRAKGSDTFLPMGSVFVTADEIPDPQDLRIRSWRIPGHGPDAGTRDPDAGRDHLRHDLGRRRADRVHQPRRSPSTRAMSSRPGRRRASGSSATRRSSSSPATGSAARSRGSARSRTRSSTGSRTSTTPTWSRRRDFELDDLIGRP